MIKMLIFSLLCNAIYIYVALVFIFILLFQDLATDLFKSFSIEVRQFYDKIMYWLLLKLKYNGF